MEIGDSVDDRHPRLRGPSLEQMVRAADLLATPARLIFFHCIAGHHRTSLGARRLPDQARGLVGRRAWARSLSPPGRTRYRPIDHRRSRHLPLAARKSPSALKAMSLFLHPPPQGDSRPVPGRRIKHAPPAFTFQYFILLFWPLTGRSDRGCDDAWSRPTPSPSPSSVEIIMHDGERRRRQP